MDTDGPETPFWAMVGYVGTYDRETNQELPEICNWISLFNVRGIEFSSVHDRKFGVKLRSNVYTDSILNVGL